MTERRTDIPFDTSELRSLTDVAAKLARSVGEEVRSLREAGVNVAATKSSLTDVVTAADQEAEQRIIEGLRALRPQDGLLGEEGASSDGSTGITWVIDPIDGTVNYLYGIPAYAVSIAAMIPGAAGDPGVTEDGRRAIAGAVYVPAADELFTATLGAGAQLNGRELSGPADTDLESALLGTGFGYTIERRTEQAEVVRRLIPKVRDIRRIGSAATDLCYLAAGRLDAFYERGLQSWDYAAAALIARESGALVLGALRHRTYGSTIELDPGEPMLIAAAPKLARVVQAEVAAAYRDIDAT